MKNKKPAELSLTAAWDRDTKGRIKEAYSGEFHLQPSQKRDKRVVNKRSNLQEFTCR